MEFVGQPRSSEACSFLGVPGPSPLDLDDDEGEIVIGIRPKSSPLPRRRSSDTDEDSEPEPPLCGSRRVSFADAKGLCLVQVKEFDNWDVPKLPRYDSPEGKAAEEYFLSPLNFSLPLPTEELFVKVREQKVELETVELLPGTTILKGTIRVLNISFTKAVYIRTTLDTWSSHFDLLAEYIPGSSEDLMDCFSFKLTLVPPFGEQGARVDFCLRYETPVGTFWANNNNRNYVLFCHLREREVKQKPPRRENVNKKSCLKTVCQNFSTAENISAVEDLSQENISADMIKKGQKVDPISDGQAETSGDGQNLLAESGQNCSRRSRRKVARMARVRDYFAQRNGGANGTERDELPPEAKQAPPEENRSDLQLFSEGSSKPEGSRFSSGCLETCIQPLLHVPHDTSPAQDGASNGAPRTSESIKLADSATLTGGESASDILDSPLNSNNECGPAECQNTNKSVSTAEESSQQRGRSYECTSNAAAEPADSVILAVASEGLVSRTNSYTFGTVMAPLYHQVFGRVESESQSLGDRGNAGGAALNVGDLAHVEKRETAPTDTSGDKGKVQGNAIDTQQSSGKRADATLSRPPTDSGEGTSLSVIADDVLDLTEIKHSDQRYEVPKTNSGDTVGCPHTVNMLNTELSNSQILADGLHLWGEAQEDSLTCDLQGQTTAETAQAARAEHTHTQSTTAPDETLGVMTALVTSLMSLQPSRSASGQISDQTDQQTSSSGANDCKCVEESNKDNDVDEMGTKSSTSNGILEEGELLEASFGLNLNHIDDTAPEEHEKSYGRCYETAEERDIATPSMSPEALEEASNAGEGNKVETTHPAEMRVIGEVAESMPKAVMNSHGDVFPVLKDEDALKDKAAIISEATERRKMEAAVSKQEDFTLTDATEAQNWEMMVEEEEKNTLTNEEESMAMGLKAEDVEAVADNREGLLKRAGRETATENRGKEREKTQEEVRGKTKAAREEDEDVSEDKQRIGQAEIREIMARKEVETYVKATSLSAGEGPADEAGVKKREEQKETALEEEQWVAEMQEGINVQEDETRVGKGEMEIDLNGDGEADVEREDQVKPRGGHVDKENPNDEDEAPVDEEIVATESESMTTEDGGNEAGCFEERLDITQNKAEGGLSALVNNVQDEGVTDEEDTGEGRNAHLPAEVYLCKEEGFKWNDIVAHDLSGAAREENESAAAAGGLCLFDDEPESDQTSHDSSSAESDSDDEVELYMHCLRAVHTGPQAHKDRDKDTGFGAGKRPSVSRSKLLSAPMPSISESQDEEQHFSCRQDNHEDTGTADFWPTAAALPASSGQESIDGHVSWWSEIFTCSNISKTVLYTALLVLFLVVAYHYDFLACFGLYLISVVWLYCQGERQPIKRTTKE